MDGTTSRIVLVTGAAGGIGRAMVASLLAAGHRIAALDHDANGCPSSNHLRLLCALSNGVSGPSVG